MCRVQPALRARRDFEVPKVKKVIPARGDFRVNREKQAFRESRVHKEKPGHRGRKAKRVIPASEGLRGSRDLQEERLLLRLEQLHQVMRRW